VVPLPNITNIFYGRDVGYLIERIELDESSEAISATQMRRLSMAPLVGAMPLTAHALGRRCVTIPGAPDATTRR
jgi:hypothetical protein